MFKHNYQKINRQYQTFETRKELSPANYGHVKVTVPAICSALSGKFLDIGCGDMPFKPLIQKYVREYDSIDVEKRTADVQFIGTVQDMSMISDQSYDSAMCLEVLEHVSDPNIAISEICRILKKKGKLVCSVPHLSRLHEVPHDYFRYTKYGIRSLFEHAGFKVISIIPRGGLFSFLGHQLSTILLCLTWNIPLLRSVSWVLNKYMLVRGVYFLDQITDREKIFALGYTCVFEKI